MTLRIITLINFGLLLLAHILSYREPGIGATVRGVVALFDVLILVRILMEGEYTETSLGEDREVLRSEEPLRYWLGVAWILLLAVLCGGAQVFWRN